MYPNPPLFASNPIVGWAILVVAVLVALWIALKIVRKTIKVSIRIGIAIGVLALIAAGLCWLSSVWGELPLW